jgi:PhzF family phenazine biosynthesis protein
MCCRPRQPEVSVSRTYRFSQLDVFTDQPLMGNPLAVVHDAQGLSTDEMQRFTDWTNLSEATFLAPPAQPEADYAVRIFTPGRELPFAGHPTLGSCHAWLEAGGVPRGTTIIQECGVGLVPIRRDEASGRLAFAAPPLQRKGPLGDEDVERIARCLRIPPSAIVDHAWCHNGPEWRAVLLGSAAEVLAVQPDATLLEGMDLGVVGLHPAGGEVQLEVRSFFPGASGLTEDPVTGSLNAGVAQWLIGTGRLPDRYVAAQGTAMGRAGRVVVERDGDDIWVGGHSVTVVAGTVSL